MLNGPNYFGLTDPGLVSDKARRTFLESGAIPDDMPHMHWRIAPEQVNSAAPDRVLHPMSHEPQLRDLGDTGLTATAIISDTNVPDVGPVLNQWKNSGELLS